MERRSAALAAELSRRLLALGARPGDRLLLAFSGGVDSLVLLHLLLSLRRPGPRASRLYRVSAAHLDHGVRGGESARAAAACAGLCRRLRVPLAEGRLDAGEVRAQRRKQRSLEAGLRALRYRFLARAAREAGARFILTAHHADDQAETVLMRAGAGKDWRSLAGIPEARGLLLRPLLGVSRAQLLACALDHGLAPVEDASNLDPAFARNRVRHALLPALEESFHPGVRGLLLRLAGAARALEAWEGRALDRVGAPAPGAAAERRALLALPPALREPAAQRILHGWLGKRPSRAQVAAFLRLASRGEGAQEVAGGALRVVKGRIVFRKGRPARHRKR